MEVLYSPLMGKEIYIIGRSLISKGKIDEVKVLISKSSDELSLEKSFWRYLLIADFKRMTKDFEAIIFYHRALLLAFISDIDYKGIAKIVGKLALCYQNKGEHNKAIYFFEQALFLEPNDRQNIQYCFTRLGISFAKLADWPSLQKLIKDMHVMCQQNGNPLDFHLFLIGIINAVGSPNCLAFLHSLIHDLRSFHETKWSAFIEFEIAYIERLRGNHKESLLHLNKSQELVTKIPIDKSIEPLLSDQYYLLRRLNKFHEALRHIEKCLSLEGMSKWFKLETLLAASLMYRFMGQYNNAIEATREAITLSKQLGLSYYLAYANNLIGIIYTILGDYDHAMSHYKRSLRLYKENNDSNGIGHCLGAIAWTKSNKGNYTEAEDYYRKSINTFETNNHPVPIMILLALANLLSLQQKNKDEMKQLLKKAEIIVRESDQNLDHARYFNILGSIALNEKKFDEALTNYLTGLTFAGDFFETEAEILLGISKTYLIKYIEQEDDETLEKALEHLKGLETKTKNLKLVNAEINLTLATIYLHKGDFDKAKESLREVVKNESIYSIPRIKKKANQLLKELEIYIKHSLIMMNIGDFNIYGSDSINDVLEHLNQAISLLRSYASRRESKVNGKK